MSRSILEFRKEQALVDAVLRNNFPSFVQRCLLTLNPGAPFFHNWHLDAIAYALERVRRGEITRLIINLPPRSLKSLMVSVAFPAFLLGHDPRRKIFGVSYGADLSGKHAHDCRAVMQSDWFRRAFPAMQIARATETEIHSTLRGFRKATSVHAALTGFGGDCFILDDPQKPIDAQSAALRSSMTSWFSNTFLSRLDDKKTGAVVVVMQRVHLNDLTGYLRDSSDRWTVLSLPAIAEADEWIPVGDGQFYFRKSGEPLHAAREPLDILNALQRELGSDIFSAQYQQSPVPAGGAMIRREWLRYYDAAPQRTYETKIIQSWDTAAKAGSQNDWSVCTTWLVQDQRRYFLLDVTRGRYEYPDLKRTVMALAERYKPDMVLIEDASTGIALAQELRRECNFPITPVPVAHDKVGRVYVQQAKFEGSQVLFPKNAAFLNDLENELLRFPQGKTDDIVDSISQALAYEDSGYDSSLSWV